MTRSSYNCIASHKSIVKTKKGIFYKTNSASCSWLSYHSKANVTERRSSENYFCCLRLSMNIIISQIMTTIAASESSPLITHAASFSTTPSSHAAIMTIAIVRISRDSFILLVYYTYGHSTIPGHDMAQSQAALPPHAVAQPADAVLCVGERAHAAADAGSAGAA